MSLFSAIGRKPEQRSASLAATLLAVGKDTRAGGGGDMGADSAQRVAAVWGCVRLLSDTVSTMPVDVVRTMGGLRSPVDPKPGLILLPDGRPMISWLRRVMWSWLLAGNAYGQVIETTPDMRYPTRIALLHPEVVSVRVVNGMEKPFIDGKQREWWPLGDIWHEAAYERPGSRVGMSPVEYAEAVIGTAEEAQDFAEDFFESNLNPGALVTSNQELSPDQASAIKTAMKRAVRDRDLLVLGSGLEWHQMQVNPKDSQFLDSMQWTAQQICGAIFGVPPEMLGYATSGQSVTYANATDRDLTFLKYGLGPWLARIEDALSRLLPGSQTVKFNTGGLLRADIKTRYETYAIAADIEAKTGKPLLLTDEMRAYEDLAPLGGATNAP